MKSVTAVQEKHVCWGSVLRGERRVPAGGAACGDGVDKKGFQVKEAVWAKA